MLLQQTLRWPGASTNPRFAFLRASRREARVKAETREERARLLAGMRRLLGRLPVGEF